ncbi:MAG: zinc ribbon domain-containing protein [candidate division Zixibacteria bacterium]|nr:zinc ribbon domain-containing protein [candidate division Zixibacteria bacterium]
MPIYEYNCKQCNSDFEELVRGNEETVCPSCGSSEIEQKLSVCGFKCSSVFVGSTGSSCSGCTKNSCSGCSSLTINGRN